MIFAQVASEPSNEKNSESHLTRPSGYHGHGHVFVHGLDDALLDVKILQVGYSSLESRYSLEVDGRVFVPSCKVHSEVVSLKSCIQSSPSFWRDVLRQE